MFRRNEGVIKKFFKQLRVYFYNRSKVIGKLLTIFLLIIAIILFNKSQYKLYIINSSYKLYENISRVINQVKNFSICESCSNIDIELENQDLKLQNKILNEKIQLLKSKLHFIDNNKYKYITAIITQVTYPRDEIAFVVSVGEKDGVRVGNVVIDDSGIVGRVSSITSDYSVISLIGNENVKISAIVTGKELDCIVGKKIGENHLEINYLSDLEAVSHRDKVISSGKDGFTPYGIEIGTIDKSGSKVSLLVKNRSKSTTIVKIIINESLNL
jgi:rod shape-determining protein MreC